MWASDDGDDDDSIGREFHPSYNNTHHHRVIFTSHHWRQLTSSPWPSQCLGPGPSLLHKTLPIIWGSPWLPPLKLKPETKDKNHPDKHSPVPWPRIISHAFYISSQYWLRNPIGWKIRFLWITEALAVGEESCCLGWLGPPTTLFDLHCSSLMSNF